MGYKLQRGDTLVEVLMAIVILSLVVVGAMTMMTRGLAAAQIALEHSQVRLSVNGQIEMLRFARDAYLKDPANPSATQWNQIITNSNAQPVVYDDACQVTGTKSGFYLTKTGTQIMREEYTPSVPATVALPGQGLWVEARLSNGATPAYVDFVIRACWQASGSAAQQRTATAVRLYDPTR